MPGMNMMDLQLDPSCDVCNDYFGPRGDRSLVVDEGRYRMAVVLNPKLSPHAFRTAIVPYGHLRNADGYAPRKLDEDEMHEFNELFRKSRSAIVRASEKVGLKLKQREGFPLIDFMVRPSRHPSGDLIPHYDGDVIIGGKKLLQYVDTRLKSGDGSERSIPTVVGSFAKEENIPEELKRILVSELQRAFWSVPFEEYSPPSDSEETSTPNLIFG